MAFTKILSDAQRLSTPDELQLTHVSAIDINEDISPLKPHHAYYLPTPYDMFGAGRILMDAMRHTEIHTGSETNLH